MSGPVVLEHDLMEQLVPISKTSSYSNSFRGVTLLAELLKDSQGIYRVYHSRCHIFVLLDNAKTLVAFDNVPQWAHPDKIDVSALLSSLKSDSPNLPHIFSLKYSSPVVNLHVDSSMFLSKPENGMQMRHSSD